MWWSCPMISDGSQADLGGLRDSVWERTRKFNHPGKVSPTQTESATMVAVRVAEWHCSQTASQNVFMPVLIDAFIEICESTSWFANFTEEKCVRGIHSEFWKDGCTPFAYGSCRREIISVMNAAKVAKKHMQTIRRCVKQDYRTVHCWRIRCALISWRWLQGGKLIFSITKVKNVGNNSADAWWKSCDLCIERLTWKNNERDIYYCQLPMVKMLCNRWAEAHLQEAEQL